MLHPYRSRLCSAGVPKSEIRHLVGDDGPAILSVAHPHPDARCLALGLHHCHPLASQRSRAFRPEQATVQIYRAISANLLAVAVERTAHAATALPRREGRTLSIG